MAEKRWPQEEKSSHHRAPRHDASPYANVTSGDGTAETGRGGKCQQDAHALDTGGGYAVTISGIPSPHRFRVSPNGKPRVELSFS